LDEVGVGEGKGHDLRAVLHRPRDTGSVRPGRSPGTVLNAYRQDLRLRRDAQRPGRAPAVRRDQASHIGTVPIDVDSAVAAWGEQVSSNEEVAGQVRVSGVDPAVHDRNGHPVALTDRLRLVQMQERAMPLGVADRIGACWATRHQDQQHSGQRTVADPSWQ
jgi:hypothetical protein